MSSSSTYQSEVDPPSTGISDTTNFLCSMKRENDEILANEDENRDRSRSSQKHSDPVSRKRDEPEDKTKHQNEQSNSNKRSKVSVDVDTLPEPPACFNTLDDDCLGNVLDFVGKKCYSVFGRLNKRCHDMFYSKGLPKETYLYGYGSLSLIQQRGRRFYDSGYSKGVLHFNRRDIFDWMLTSGSNCGHDNLKILCFIAIKESRLDILREVFDRVNEEQLEYLRDFGNGLDLCTTAAQFGKLECMKFLRENENKLDRWTWFIAKEKGHKHILENLRNNGYATEWQK